MGGQRSELQVEGWSLIVSIHFEDKEIFLKYFLKVKAGVCERD